MAMSIRLRQVLAFVRRHPDWSDARIGRATGACMPTVAKARRLLVARGEIPARADRVHMIEGFIRLHSEWADIRICRALGASPRSVRRARGRLVMRGEIPDHDTVIREDGRPYWRRRRRTPCATGSPRRA